MALSIANSEIQLSVCPVVLPLQYLVSIWISEFEIKTILEMKPSRLTALSCWCRPAHSADVEGFGPLQQQRKSVSSWFCCSVKFPLCMFKINVLILWTHRHSLIMQALVALQCSVCCRLARRCLTLGWCWWTDQSPTSALRAPPSCTCLFFNEWCRCSAFR